MTNIAFQKGTITMDANGLHNIELFNAAGERVYQANIEDADVKELTEEYPASIQVLHVQEAPKKIEVTEPQKPVLYYADFCSRTVERREVTRCSGKTVLYNDRLDKMMTMVGAWCYTEQEAIDILYTNLERNLRSAESTYQARQEQYDTFIKKYPGAIPEREPGRPVRLSMVIMSHLSDIQTGYLDGLETRRRCNFIKWLLIQQPDTNLEVDIDSLWEEFLTTRFA